MTPSSPSNPGSGPGPADRAQGVDRDDPVLEAKAKGGLAAAVSGAGCFLLASVPIGLLALVGIAMYLIKGCGGSPTDPPSGPVP